MAHRLRSSRRGLGFMILHPRILPSRKAVVTERGMRWLECRMADAPRQRGFPRSLLVLVVLATALAAWLRTHGLADQVVLDDEWHAIHELMSSSYRDIFRTFGLADHSIPLTLFYKAMADTVGLTEGRLRALQSLRHHARVPLCGWLAWRVTRDAPAASLFAFLVAGAPFLVLWSRFARPYAITLLLSVVCVACVWAWRTQRSRRLAWIAVASGALAAWLHPIAGLYGAIPCLFVFGEDVLAARRNGMARRWRRSLALGAAMAAAMALLLAAPWINDRQSLFGKSGIDHPRWGTLDRLIAIVWGGVPGFVMAVACVCAAAGVVALWRRDRPLAAYLVALGALPGTILAIIGASYIYAGQNFLRYQLPLLPLLLFFGSVGATALIRAIGHEHRQVAAWTGSIALSCAYLAATPAIAQVARLGPWYAHIDYHWDYRYRWIEYLHPDHSYDPPRFYRKLARLAPGTATIIEAPFEWEAPLEQLAYYATFHRQKELFGMLHDLCLQDRPRVGEVAHDARFRFHLFVFLDHPAEVRATGARYLVLHLAMPHGRPFPEARRCFARLEELYGPPMEKDERVAVFDLRPGDPAPKLQ